MIAALRELGRSMTRKNSKPQSQEIKTLLAANCARLNISVVRRLDRLDSYKRHIARYQRARARKLSRVRPGKRLAIYTAICSGYDSIKLPNTLDPRLDYIPFSDTPAPATGLYSSCGPSPTITRMRPERRALCEDPPTPATAWLRHRDLDRRSHHDSR
jgi:hypothetical protein